jgi:hypothetical protein
VLLPVLTALPQPLALLEDGASAGLCLYPDRYAYRYGEHGSAPENPSSSARRSEWRRRANDPMKVRTGVIECR